MELTHLQEFVILARMQNFMAAADEMYISQSSLSKHIKTIESELGYTLFDRSTRNVRLSRFGEAFLPFAERIVAMHTEALNTLSMVARDTDDSLRLGVLPAFSIYGIYEKLGEYRKRYPSYTVSMIESGNDELLRSLQDGRCNLVMIRHDEQGLPPKYGIIPMATDCISLVLPLQHPLGRSRDTIPVQELDGMELITSTSSFMARTLNRIAETNGIHFNLVARFSHSDLVVRTACEENRPAVLMHAPTEARHTGLVKILDITPSITNAVSFVYMRQKPLNSATKAFIRMLFPGWEEEKAHD